MALPLDHSLGTHGPYQEGRFGNEDLEDSGHSPKVSISVVLILVLSRVGGGPFLRY